MSLINHPAIGVPSFMEISISPKFTVPPQPQLLHHISTAPTPILHASFQANEVSAWNEPHFATPRGLYLFLLLIRFVVTSSESLRGKIAEENKIISVVIIERCGGPVKNPFIQFWDTKHQNSPAINAQPPSSKPN